MIYVLLAALAALVAWLWVSMQHSECNDTPHPLDGPTKQAQLNPEHTWPFPPNKP